MSPGDAPRHYNLIKVVSAEGWALHEDAIRMALVEEAQEHAREQGWPSPPPWPQSVTATVTVRIDWVG